MTVCAEKIFYTSYTNFCQNGQIKIANIYWVVKRIDCVLCGLNGMNPKDKITKYSSQEFTLGPHFMKSILRHFKIWEWWTSNFLSKVSISFLIGLETLLSWRVQKSLSSMPPRSVWQARAIGKFLIVWPLMFVYFFGHYEVTVSFIWVNIHSMRSTDAHISTIFVENFLYF